MYYYIINRILTNKESMFIKVMCIVAMTLVSINSVAEGKFPSKPITFIVPWPAGGTADGSMRAIGESMSKTLNVPVVIENKPGASGILGVSQLISAKPDGYTIGQIPLAITRFAHMGTINFDPLTDITYLGRTAGLTFGLVVNSSSPIKTFEDYVKYAKANPGKLSYGSTGIGTSTHVYMEDLAYQMGIKLNHIPFKGGSDNLNAILGNHTDSMMDSSVWMPHVLSGKLRLLAVFTEKRIDRFPNVPTISELGVNISGTAPNGIGAPKGIDPKIAKILEAAIEKAAKDTPHLDALSKYDMPMMWLNSKDYTSYIKEIYDKERNMVNRLNLKGKP
jgi:tripartite-type tricarboxylate transporter receptor subunit TctC